MYRRQKEQYVFGAVVGIVGVLSVLSLLILYLPIRSEYLALEASITRYREETAQRAAELARLNELEGRLNQSRGTRHEFLALRSIPRSEGFAAILPDLERLAQIAGIERNAVLYDLDPVPEFGIYELRISIPVQGSYAAVTRFIRELEDADTLFIVESIALNLSQFGAPNALSLALNVTTFFSYGS